MSSSLLSLSFVGFSEFFSRLNRLCGFADGVKGGRDLCRIWWNLTCSRSSCKRFVAEGPYQVKSFCSVGGLAKTGVLHSLAALGRITFPGLALILSLPIDQFESYFSVAKISVDGNRLIPST